MPRRHYPRQALTLVAFDLWMHQLGGVTNGPRLNRPEFDRRLKNMLAAVSASRQPDAMIESAVVEAEPVPAGAE